MDAIADRPARGPIRAAGGLVGRDGSPGESGSPADQHVLLVHRPRFDDWSLPKGKLKRGEHPLAAAVREVHEETTVWGVPGVRLPSVSYQVWSGQSLVDKTVDWWAMTAAEVGPFIPSDEVDELTWLPMPRALETLTYERDRLVLSAYADLPRLSRPVVLLPHASVAASQSWSGPDREQPLDSRGEAQARTLADLVALLRPGRLVSAQAARCRQTLGDLARSLGIEVEVDTRFDDGADPAVAAAALRSLAGDTTTVVCSHHALIPAALSRLSARPEPDHAVPVGGALALSFSAQRLVASDPLAPNPSETTQASGPSETTQAPGPSETTQAPVTTE